MANRLTGEVTSRPPHFGQCIESIAYAFVGTLLAAFAIAFPAIIITTEGARDRGGMVVLSALGLAWCLFDLPYLYFLWTGLRAGRHPLAIDVALRQPRWPLPLRIISTVWWTVHFLLGTITAIMMHGFQFENSHGISAVDDRFIMTVVVTAFTFGYSIAANGFLMLALTSLTRNDAIRDRVWRFRFLIDLSIAGLAILLPSMPA